MKKIILFLLVALNLFANDEYCEKAIGDKKIKFRVFYYVCINNDLFLQYYGGYKQSSIAQIINKSCKCINKNEMIIRSKNE